MARVPQKTLSWLYDVLKREYRDPNRTYSDLAHVLARHPGFAPRTDVYTFETGAPALLVQFKGTIPVNFRGNAYRFPVALWVPHAYPYEAPMCYVTPTEDMIIRPGQHVAGDGRIYHPYLAHWRDHWERSNVLDFLSILSDIFAKEPPVMSSSAQSQQRPVQPTPPPVPPLPREMQPPPQSMPDPRSPPQIQQPGSHGPPPPPPKPGYGNSARTISSSPASRPGRYDAPPPLPSQPQGQLQRLQNQYSNGDTRGPPSGLNYMPQRSSSLRNSMPPAPLQQQHQPAYESQQYRPQAPRPGESQPYPQAVNGHVPHVMSPPAPQPQVQAQGYTQPQALTPNNYDPNSRGPPQGQPERPIPQHYQAHNPQQPHPHPQYSHQYSQPQIQAPKPAPPHQPNLLDSPFDLPLPALTTSNTHPSSNIPAPPIPINPQKEALLSHLSHLLTTSLHNQIAQSHSAIAPLTSQHTALQQTAHLLTTELSTLKSLHQTLSSNISVLQTSLKAADGTISSSHARAQRNDVPSVDEMLTCTNGRRAPIV